jgi:hypothetical protein
MTYLRSDMEYPITVTSSAIKVINKHNISSFLRKKAERTLGEEYRFAEMLIREKILKQQVDHIFNTYYEKYGMPTTHEEAEYLLNEFELVEIGIQISLNWYYPFYLQHLHIVAYATPDELSTHLEMLIEDNIEIERSKVDFNEGVADDHLQSVYYNFGFTSSGLLKKKKFVFKSRKNLQNIIPLKLVENRLEKKNKHRQYFLKSRHHTRNRRFQRRIKKDHIDGYQGSE